MTPEQEVYLGQRAKEVIENEAYIAAFDAIRQELIDQWQESPARDKDGRETLWLMLKQLDKLKLTLEGTMSAGRMKAADLTYREKTKLQRWLGAS
jgi:hypothetical protein